MAIMNFYVTAQKIMELQEEGKYKEALDLTLKAHKNFTKQHNRTGYWLACLYSKLDDKGNAIQSLREWINEGYWTSPKTLSKETDLDNIRNTEEFKKIIEINKKRFEEEKKYAKPEVSVIIPKSYSKDDLYPLLIAIHWRGSNIEEFSHYYKDVVIEEETVLGVVQSSQLCGDNMYCWDDYDKAKQEIEEHYDKIMSEYSVNNDDVILSGASQGGKLSIELALEDIIECRGFISVIPYLPDINDYTDKIAQAVKKGIKAVIITGDKDISYENTIELSKKMKDAGMDFKLFVKKNMGHTIPSDFKSLLKTSIDFIMND
ncbi:MAG: alpha/beta hydrolase [Spirochaetota bacterium]